MRPVKGFFGLATADDLYAKLLSDYDRLKAAPADPRVAFDLVVTAWHLTEWRFTRSPERAAMLERRPILRVCEHLAVGAKHFEPTDKRLSSVAGMATRRRGFLRPWAPRDRIMHPARLIVQLDGEAKRHFGDALTMGQLAGLVMDAWGEEFAER